MIYGENVIWVKDMSVPKLPYSLACKRKDSVPLSSKDFIFRTILFKPKGRFSKEICTCDMIITQPNPHIFCMLTVSQDMKN